MVKQSKRMPPAIIVEDEESLAALKAITDYAPPSPAYSVAAIEQAYEDLQEARTAEVQADAAAKAASDNVVGKQAHFHDLVLGAKDQVTAQFGRDSNQAQSVGRKKPSEYKPRVRGTKRGSGENPVS